MTLTEIIELRKKRRATFEQARALIDAAKKEERELTSEERSKYDNMLSDVDKMKETIEREERALEIEDGFKLESYGKQGMDGEGRAETDDEKNAKAQKRHNAFLGWVRCGYAGITQEERTVLDGMRDELPPEARALQVATGAAGGYTVPEDFYRAIVDAMKDFSGVLQAGPTIINSATGADLPIPTDDDTASKGEQVSEGSAASEGDVTFGQKILKAWMYSSKLIRVSNLLLQDSAFGLEAWLARKFAERIGRILNELFTTGAGTTEPQGVVTAATLGKTGASGQTTSVIYDDLVDLEHSIDVAYRKNARWMLNDLSLKAIKKMVDSNDRPLWIPGIAVRQPDTILGYPYVANPEVDAMAASKKSILFGDFGNYFVRNVQGAQMLRLTERYAEYNQTAFVLFERHDGQLIDAGQHPIKYYANAAS